MSLPANARLVSQGGGHFLLQGTLDFATVPRVFADSQSCFHGGGQTVVDLAGVTSSNSAGMALLLEWRARAHTARHSLTLLNIPHNLQKIAQVCGVEHLLLAS